MNRACYATHRILFGGAGIDQQWWRPVGVGHPLHERVRGYLADVAELHPYGLAKDEAAKWSTIPGEPAHEAGEDDQGNDCLPGKPPAGGLGLGHRRQGEQVRPAIT
jgi:hypothetical protein